MTDLRQRETGKPPAPRRTLGGYGRGFWFKFLALALVDAVAVWAAVVLAADGAMIFLVSLVIGTLFVNWVYLWPRTQALRWVTPGLMLMLVFLVAPIIYTFYISFTNWATGNVLQKEHVITNLESRLWRKP